MYLKLRMERQDFGLLRSQPVLVLLELVRCTCTSLLRLNTEFFPTLFFVQNCVGLLLKVEFVSSVRQGELLWFHSSAEIVSVPFFILVACYDSSSQIFCINYLFYIWSL